MGLYLWVCRQCVPVDTSRPTKLVKLFSLPSGYRTELDCILGSIKQEFTGSQIKDVSVLVLVEIVCYQDTL